MAFNIFRTALDSPADFEDFAFQFYGRFRHQPQMVEMMIDILLRVSVADGALTVSEETLILSAVQIFQMNQARYEQIKAQYSVSSDQPYHVLGSRRSDSDEAIKKRYRQLVQAYHPDKIASKGLPEEFTRLAEEKFREIQAAYEDIRKERGLK